MVGRFNYSFLAAAGRQEVWGTIPITGPVCVQNTSTDVFLFQLMYGSNLMTPSRGYEDMALLQAKMAELQDLVEAHIVESAHRQN